MNADRIGIGAAFRHQRHVWRLAWRDWRALCRTYLLAEIISSVVFGGVAIVREMEEGRPVAPSDLIVAATWAAVGFVLLSLLLLAGARYRAPARLAQHLDRKRSDAQQALQAAQERHAIELAAKADDIAALRRDPAVLCNELRASLDGLIDIGSRLQHTATKDEAESWMDAFSTLARGSLTPRAFTQVRAELSKAAEHPGTIAALHSDNNFHLIVQAHTGPVVRLRERVTPADMRLH